MCLARSTVPGETADRVARHAHGPAKQAGPHSRGGEVFSGDPAGRNRRRRDSIDERDLLVEATIASTHHREVDRRAAGGRCLFEIPVTTVVRQPTAYRPARDRRAFQMRGCWLHCARLSAAQDPSDRAVPPQTKRMNRAFVARCRTRCNRPHESSGELRSGQSDSVSVALSLAMRTQCLVAFQSPMTGRPAALVADDPPHTGSGGSRQSDRAPTGRLEQTSL